MSRKRAKRDRRHRLKLLRASGKHPYDVTFVCLQALAADRRLKGREHRCAERRERRRREWLASGGKR